MLAVPYVYMLHGKGIDDVMNGMLLGLSYECKSILTIPITLIDSVYNFPYISSFLTFQYISKFSYFSVLRTNDLTIGGERVCQRY